ncbi:MAG: phosphatidate cytidylyltransferase [Solirubrobacteraceae bacterium]|jgi:phosphatidate cytidylyltransferase|nr:phosphatidate cytidylyltransferase [Solirubrobacteraceae bacterium]MDP4672592.1 phosphatidate cytidylyltransferase [Solirubrobacteraceae bacterium]MDP4921654.1 phosphatidate cytidylyltransferase [Solirubrobacteraceae bacterium]
MAERLPPTQRSRGARLRWLELRNGGSDLTARVATAVPLALLAIALVAIGGWVFGVGIFVLGVIALRELFSMFERLSPPILAGFVGLLLLLIAAETGGPSRVLLALVVSFVVVFLISISDHQPTSLPGLAIVILGLVWIGLAFSHAIMLRELVHGSAIVFLVLIATFLTDTGAYFGGRAFGRRSLAPRISPAKTIEGLLIGVVAGTAAAWFTGLYFDWLSGVDALILGFSVALVAPLGDLFESYVKREASVKDSGTIFGAHGGVLDRLDAVCFSIVAGYYVWTALL